MTHLLSGGEGAPGALLACINNAWTSVKVNASPSAKSPNCSFVASSSWTYLLACLQFASVDIAYDCPS